MLLPDPSSRVQRAILCEYLTTGSTLARLFDLGVALLVWPLRSTLAAWRLSRSVGGEIADVRRPSVQFIHQLGLAWFHGISPVMYYQMGIATSRSRQRPTCWLQDGYAGLLSRVFRDDKRLIELNDKARFAEIMKSAGIRHPDTVIVAATRAGDDTALLEMLTRHRELFVKRSIGHGGKGSRLLIREASGRWSVHHQQPSPDQPVPVLDEQVLVQQLRASARAGALLIQPRLSNHSLLARLFGPGLVSVRLVSARSEQRFVLLGVLVSFAAPDRLVSQRGLKVGVDRQTGEMGRVFRYSPDQREYAANPYTEQPVEGVRLPFWKEAVEMVQRAHSQLRSYPFLGWDVAICPDGPTMLEANGNFGLAGLQRPQRKPLINREFLAVFNDWKQAGPRGGA